MFLSDTNDFCCVIQVPVQQSEEHVTECKRKHLGLFLSSKLYALPLCIAVYLIFGKQSLELALTLSKHGLPEQGFKFIAPVPCVLLYYHGP